MAGRHLDWLRLVGVAGANRVMAGELSRLCRRAFDDVRLPEPRKDAGSVYYPFVPKVAALAVRYHRTSARVLWDLYGSDAARLEPLYEDLCACVQNDPRRWWQLAAPRSELALSVEAFGVGDYPAGERQIVGTVKNAVVDGLANHGVFARVDAHKPDVVLSVRLRELPGEHAERGEKRESSEHSGARVASVAPRRSLVVSLDLAGRPMHQRGYRLSSGEAPLREDLAAILLMLSRFDARRDVLIDPMAGSGTIAIEAACMARGRPVWQSGRQPLASRLSVFSEWFSQRAAPLFGDTQAKILASDRDVASIEALNKNAQTAGVDFEVRGQDFRALAPTEILEWAEQSGRSSGLILCNPPYGSRLDGDTQQLRQLYSDLGRWCRRFPGWRAGMLVASDDFLPAFGGRPRITKPMSNGPLRGYFYLYDL